MWPQPHPSPPLPPPREYGAPGTPPDRRHWWWAALASAVVVLVTVALVVLLRSGGDDNADDGADDGAVDRAGAGAAASERPDPTTHASPSATASTAPAAAGPYRCWDGAEAPTLKGCSQPTGAEGLRWVFPRLAEQRCGTPTTSGPGVVLRILCAGRFADGSRIQVGYYQWESVREGVAFYDAQGLERSEGTGFHYWLGTSGSTAKSAVLYAGAPFSFTLTVATDAQVTDADLEQVQPRPPEELRGVPTG